MLRLKNAFLDTFADENGEFRAGEVAAALALIVLGIALIAWASTI